MANEVEKKSVFGTKVGSLNTDALKEAMANSAAKDPRGAAPDGSEYLNFSGKRGIYELGEKKADIDPDESWLVNVAAFQDGWMCWKGGRPVAQRLYPIGTAVPEPDKNEHGPFNSAAGEGWSQAKAMVLRSIDTGVQAYFKINSVSGVSVLAGLQKDITERMRAGLPYWPVVMLSKEKFTSGSFTNYKPKITIDGWLNDMQVIEELPVIFEDEKAEIDLEEMYAAAIAPAAADKQIEQKAETAAPVRRNRRANTGL